MPSTDVEEGEGLSLQYCGNVNGVETLRGVTSFVVHNERNLLFCGFKGFIACFDAVTTTRQHTIPIPMGHTPSFLTLLPGNKHLVIVCKEWTLYLHALESTKTTMILNLHDTKKSELLDPVFAVLGSDVRPVIFIAARGKDALRTVHLGVKGDKSKEMMPGNKVMLDKGNGVMAVAVHGNSTCLVVLTMNGELQGYRFEAPGTLVPLYQFSMLLDGTETKERSPMVVGAQLMTSPHPYQGGTTLIFIALPRQGTLYIMEQASDSSAKATPVQQLIWRDIDHIMLMEIHPVTKLLIVVAGRLGGRHRMRAWEMVGHDTTKQLEFVERPCNQHVSQLVVSGDAASVFSQPDWAKLWEGEPTWQAVASQTEFLDLTSLPMKTAGLEGTLAVPFKGHLLGSSGLAVVRYQAQSMRGQSITPIAVFRVLDDTHPTLAHPSGNVASCHAAPFEWHTVDEDGEKVQLFPHAMYYLKDNSIMAHMTATEENKAVADIPAVDAAGRILSPDMLIYSKRTHSWLVFCKVLQDSKQRVFTQITIDTSANESTKQPPWYGPGIMGTYLGPMDERFAVLEAGEVGIDNIAIYNTAEMTVAHPPLGRTYCELGMGDCLKSIWPGPPTTFAMEEPVYDANGAVIEQEEVHGSGMVLLVTKLGQLMLALLPAPEVSSHADLEPDANPELPPLSAQCAMKLLPNERLLQVVWNTFVDSLSVGYPSHCIGAILTTHRVMMVSGNLGMLQTVPIADSNLGSLHSTHSMLWVGPALLLSHAGGRVEQLLYNGKRTHVCSLAQNGPAVLAGALGDRLLLVQQRNGEWVMTVRRIGVASLVMQGWASLLASDHVSAPWNVVRLHMQQILADYNISVSSDAALIESLIACGCGDIAMRCVDDYAEAVGISKVAHAAASGSWDIASKTVLDEYEMSAYYPCAPPPNSAFRNTLIMVALGAMSQGKWSCVDKCIKASGETLLLMLLHALQHDRAALQASADAQATSKSMHTLAMLLLAADSRVGLRVTVQKDWQLHRHQSDTDASTWTYAQDLCPKMRAKAPMSVGPSLIAPGEEGPIPAMDVGGLASHLGLTHAEIYVNAKIVATPVTSRMSEAGKSGTVSPLKGDSDISISQQPGSSKKEDEEQERARQQFLEGFQGDSLFGDDDEEQKDGEGGLISYSDAEASSRGPPKFRIQIKDSSFSAGPTGADVANAAKNIAIGGGISMAAMKKKDSSAPPASLDPWADLGMPAPNPDAEAAPEAAVQEEDPFAAFDDLALASPPKASSKLPSEQLTGGSPTSTAPSSAAVNPPPAPAISATDLDDLFGPPPSAAPAPPPAKPAPAAAPAAPPATSGAPAIAQLPPPPGAVAASRAALPQAAAAPPAAAPAPAALPPVASAAQLPGFAQGVAAMFQGQWVAAEGGFKQAFAAASLGQRRQVAQYLATIYMLAAFGMGDVLAAKLSRYAASFPWIEFDHTSFLVNDCCRRNMAQGNFAWAHALMTAFVGRCHREGRMDVAASATQMMHAVAAAGNTNRSVPETENIPAFMAAVDAAATADDIKLYVSKLVSSS